MSAEPSYVEEQRIYLLRATFQMLDTMGRAKDISSSEAVAYTEAARWIAMRLVREMQKDMKMSARAESPVPTPSGAEQAPETCSCGHPWSYHPITTSDLIGACRACPCLNLQGALRAGLLK